MTRPGTTKPAGDAAVDATISLAEATSIRWQAVVVGAGPAGFAAARRLAARGLRVLLLVAGSMPRPKLCGCCLSATAVRELTLLAGLDGETAPALPAGAIRLERVRLATPVAAAAVPFATGGVISREALDTTGVRAAINAILEETGGDRLAGLSTPTSKRLLAAATFRARHRCREPVRSPRRPAGSCGWGIPPATSSRSRGRAWAGR